MTQSLPFSTFRGQIDALCENPKELIVTEQGEPVFTLLPYDMYQSLLETLDIVADAEALGALQANLAELKAGKPVKVNRITSTTGHYMVGLTDAAYETLQAIEAPDSKSALLQCIKMLADKPETQGKALVSSLKGYRSLKAQGEKYQVIYFIEKTQVVVVFVHSTITQPDALLVHLLKNT